MEYSASFMADFIGGIKSYEEKYIAAEDAAEREISEINEQEKAQYDALSEDIQQKTDRLRTKALKDISNFRRKASEICTEDIKAKQGCFVRLEKCKEYKSLMLASEDSIENREVYEEYARIYEVEIDLSVDEIIRGDYDFPALVCEINTLLKDKKKSEIIPTVTFLNDAYQKAKDIYQGYSLRMGDNNAISRKCSFFRQLCIESNNILTFEIELMRKQVLSNREELFDSYSEIIESSSQETAEQLKKAEKTLSRYAGEYSLSKAMIKQKSEELRKESIRAKNKKLSDLDRKLIKKYSPDELIKEYSKYYSASQTYENYERAKEMPRSVHLGSLEYDTSEMNLSTRTKQMLEKNYYFIFENGKFKIPFVLPFSKEFNFVLRFDGKTREQAVENACALGMRLFTSVPPAKINFTFADPVTLGESFAMFTRLADADDRTGEVINGRIWSDPSDIESKLKIMTDRISNVTQRCLQGKYDSIYEYNKDAEQNAEPYQVLMLMDFPAGLTENSLKLLEQIVTSGPKCGVFTLLYRNESQLQKVSERLHPLISNIESQMQTFYMNEKGDIYCRIKAFGDIPLKWNCIPMPEYKNREKVISTLKKDIKSAEKVVIGIEKVRGDTEENSSAKGIKIPIGVRGAGEVQYLTLGVGGSHHGLVAGLTGAGKSSLLHTIIMGALSRYSPDELSLYLVDFKRGVEFKIYADFELPSFKVVAIESEREFGYNILLALEREQKIRADIFRKNRVDTIEEYRELGKKMSRILFIMDEFHELFSDSSDALAKNSANIMERIIRQGRAFGVHLILASQSYSNIGGISPEVLSQMAVRMVLKCSDSDANMLLKNGSSEVNQISIDDPGRAIYNSEAGSSEYNTHFRVAYADSKKQRAMLQKISEKTAKDSREKTRILLSNIEDNRYSIYNCFHEYEDHTENDSLHLGEVLSLSGSMKIGFNRRECSNLLMAGGNPDKARSMFSFSILSLCINYWLKNRKAPEEPFIYLLNCKPLEDSYFGDTLKILGQERLYKYIKYIDFERDSEISDALRELCKDTKEDKYFFVFGYQRAEALKSQRKKTSQDIFSTFNLMAESDPQLSPKEMFMQIIEKGAERGVHTILWQDSFSALEQDDKDIMSFFSMKIAFDMKAEEYSRFIGENDVSLMSENNAVYSSRTSDNQRFRPYQTPDEDWLREICKKLQEEN